MVETSLDELLAQPEVETEQSKQTDEGEQQVDEKKEDINLEATWKLAKDLQKGYTQGQQQTARLSEQMTKIQEQLEGLHGNTKIQDPNDADRYVTVADLRKIMEEAQQKPLIESAQAEELVNTTLNDMHVKGVLENAEEEKSFIDYALRNKDKMSLEEAADRWAERKDVQRETLKSHGVQVKKKVDGAKVGSSDRTSSPTKLSWKELQATSLDDL